VLDRDFANCGFGFYNAFVDPVIEPLTTNPVTLARADSGVLELASFEGAVDGFGGGADVFGGFGDVQ
jgi:hypothetical protein